MYAGTFQTDIFDSMIMHLMSHWPVISFNRVDISIKVGSFFQFIPRRTMKCLTLEVEDC